MSTELVPQTAPVWATSWSAEAANSEGYSSPHRSNFAEVWMQVGQVPLERILSEPAPGSATPNDAIDSRKKIGINCELVNGTLIAKTMGFYESHLALILAHLLNDYLDRHPIGIVAGEDGPFQLLSDNVRKPDVSFLSFARMPGGKLPREAACPIAPDLAVEVLSPSNTVAEIDLKLKQYFAAGVRLVWIIEPELRTARVFTAVDRHEDIPSHGTLRGGDVLPGFELPLARLFEKAGPRID
ncbi:MAG TPA: Uma2 family endonuclease [Pirellulaceae bacterium]